MSDVRGQCGGTVYERDTYRRTGRGKSGYEMHYNERQCTRRATHKGFCWQHSAYYRQYRAAPPTTDRAERE